MRLTFVQSDALPTELPQQCLVDAGWIRTSEDISHRVYSPAALATCIHIRKLVPRAGLEPATIRFSIQHSTN